MYKLRGADRGGCVRPDVGYAMGSGQFVIAKGETMWTAYLPAALILCLVASLQAWGMGVLLLTRQIEFLLLSGILASVFWFWCAWACFLRKLRPGLFLAGLCLLASLALTVLGLLDVLEVNGVTLLRGELSTDVQYA